MLFCISFLAGNFWPYLLDRDAVLTADVYPGKVALQILDALNETMYQEKGFRGNSANYYNPTNSYIDHVSSFNNNYFLLVISCVYN